MNTGALVAEEPKTTELLDAEERWILTVRGVRGSLPSPGLATVRYGGNTTCLELALRPDHRLIFDCGSGLRSLDVALRRKEKRAGRRFDVFLTHYHTDHLEGLRFFTPLYDGGNRFSFHGFSWQGVDVRTALEGSMRPPWFPISLSDTEAVKSYVDMKEGVRELQGLRIEAARIHHPQGSTGFRLEHAGRVVTFVTDTEPDGGPSDSAVTALSRDADVLIHDAQYTPDEYANGFSGRGHSTWQHAVAAARRSGARRLVLFHHDPERCDEELDEIVEAARGEFPETEAAREGMTFLI